MTTIRPTTLLATLLATAPFLGGAFAPEGQPATVGTVAQFGDQYQLSSECAQCHGNIAGATAMRDASGRDIGMFDLWQSSMMANAGRDPYYRATLSAEMVRHPERAAEIEQKCLGCHTPMASSGPVLDTELRMSLERLDGTDELAQLARDGVSCAACHSIAPDGLGEPSTYSGNFHVNDRREIYGPHQSLNGQRMVGRIGLNPVTANHVADDSGLCGSCHTLFTEPLNPDGTRVGTMFPEQTPYLEWRNSIYSDETPAQGGLRPENEHARSCQDCHMPRVDVDGRTIRTRVARLPNGRDDLSLPERSPYGRHVFVGGNTIIPEILRDNAAALNVTAPAAAFDATIAAATDQLRNRTANLRVTTRRKGSALLVDARIENLAGHKFPSAYPSRRTWIRLRVRDARQNLIYQSGDWDGAGRILDRNRNPLPHEAAGGPILPHRDVVVDPDQPQVWEGVLADATGGPTFSLMSAAGYVKDDRLLPKGWSPGHPDAVHTLPVGVAGDASYAAGEDTVTFVVTAPAGAGPYEIEAELVYQSIAPRWAAELFTISTPDVRAFQGYYRNATRTPVSMRTVTARVP